MSISTPKQATRSPALTAAGSKLVAIRDALSAGASLRSALLVEGLHYFTVNRWIQWENPPDHAELLAEIRDLHAGRKFRLKADGKRSQEEERRQRVQAAQATRVADMNQGDEIPLDALTYRDAAVYIGRSRDTIQGWVSAKKLRAFYRLNDQLGIESLVSRAALEKLFEQLPKARDRGLCNRSRVINRTLPKAPVFLKLIRSGHSVTKAAKTAGFSAHTVRNWRATTDENADTVIGEFLRAWRAATEVALRRRKGDGRAPERGTLVYFIGPVDGAGCIKIGRTNRKVEERFKDIQCGSPIRLKVLLTVIAPSAFEAWLHHRFAEDRSHNEWFHATPRLLSFINRLREYPDLRGVPQQSIEALGYATRVNPLFSESIHGES
jgi:transposase